MMNDLGLLGNLSPEVRVIIYGFVFGSSEVITPVRNEEHTPSAARHDHINTTAAALEPISTSILTTSKLILPEAIQVLYSEKIVRGDMRQLYTLLQSKRSEALVRDVEVADCNNAWRDRRFNSILERLQKLPRMRTTVILSDCLGWDPSEPRDHIPVKAFARAAELGKAILETLPLTLLPRPVNHLDPSEINQIYCLAFFQNSSEAVLMLKTNGNWVPLREWRVEFSKRYLLATGKFQEKDLMDAPDHYSTKALWVALELFAHETTTEEKRLQVLPDERDHDLDEDVFPSLVVQYKAVLVACWEAVDKEGTHYAGEADQLQSEGLHENGGSQENAEDGDSDQGNSEEMVPDGTADDVSEEDDDLDGKDHK